MTSSRVFYWWADHTWVQLLALITISTFAFIGGYDASLVTDLFHTNNSSSETSPNRKLIESESQIDKTDQSDQARPPENVRPFAYGGFECVLVAIIDEDGQQDLFHQDSLAAMRRVAQGLQQMPQVSSLLWLDNVPDFNLFGLSGTLLPSSNASKRQMDTSRVKVLDNPMAVGQLISADAKTVVMQLNLDWFFVTSDADATTAIRERAEALAASPNMRFMMTGYVPLDAMTASNHVHDSTKYQLIGYSIMMISALVLFRGLSAVLIVAIAPAVGVLWTSGMLCFFDLQDNPFNDIIVPVLISLVGLTDSVHLMVEIRAQRASGLETRVAARRGVARVGLACFLTSLTTAIGFLSLTTAHHEIVRDFGWCCVVGVTMTFCSVLTVIPLGCRSPLGRRLHVGLGKSLVDRHLRRIGPVVDFVLRHDRVIAMIAIVLTIGLSLVALRMQPDEKRFSGLSESGEAARALRHLDQSLGGLEFSSVMLQWGDDTSEGEVLSVLADVDQVLKREPLLGHPLGLHDLLDALPGDGTPEERMTLLDLLPAELKRAFYVPEYRTAKVQFRIQDLGIAAYGPTFERVDTSLSELSKRHPKFEIALDGNAVLRWRHIFRIVNDLMTSLGTASVVILVVLAIVYRSVRLGLISVVPNLFPLVATGAMLVMSGQHLEMVTVCVFTICVGIAVDDTIHFLTRYQEEMRIGGEHQDVIRRSFTGVGSALLMTTIVLVAGLGSAIVGDSRDARIFGIMGCLTLTTALLADILLLPALLSRFAKPKQSMVSKKS